MNSREFKCDRCKREYLPIDDVRPWAGNYVENGEEFSLICEYCHKELTR